MKISAAMFQTQYARTPHPVLTIGGESLDIWLDRMNPDKEVKDLVPAQGWLINDDDLALAWRRITRDDSDSSTIVPVLICSDDVDFSCSVVVVEQRCTSDKIIWQRFGYDYSVLGDQVGATVKWFESPSAIEFDRDMFLSALAELRRLIDHEWK
jgi:hypothetical protein